MNAGKVLGGLIISAVMILSTCLCMVSFSAEAAVSEKTIKSALVESGAIDDIKAAIPIYRVKEINSSLGEAAEDALNSGAVDDFMAEYLAAAINAQINGEEIQEISESEIRTLLSQAIDDEVSNGNLGISSGQAKVLKKTLEYVTPTITSQLNSEINDYTENAVSEDARKAIEAIRLVKSPIFRYGTMGVAFLCCLLLMLMFWESRLGLLWAAVNMFISSGIFMLIGKMFGNVGAEDTTSSATDIMLMMLVANGTKFTSIIGIIIGVLLVVLCVIMRATSRKSRKARRRAYR